MRQYGVIKVVHLIVLVMLGATTIFGKDVAPSRPAQPGPGSLSLTDVFSVEQNPGSGTIDFNKDKKLHKLQLGQEGGYYAMGIIFAPSALPALVSKDVGHQSVLTVIFGSLHKPPATVPKQFATLSIFLDRLPKRKTNFEIRPSAASSSKNRNFALMLFSDPAAPDQLSDEDKLRYTYFGTQGTISIRAFGPVKTIQVNADDPKTSASLQMQAVRLSLRTEVATPFNPVSYTVLSAVEIPVYRAKDSTSDELLRNAATTSFGANSMIQLDKTIPN